MVLYSSVFTGCLSRFGGVPLLVFFSFITFDLAFVAFFPCYGPPFCSSPRPLCFPFVWSGWLIVLFPTYCRSPVIGCSSFFFLGLFASSLSVSFFSFCSSYGPHMFFLLFSGYTSFFFFSGCLVFCCLCCLIAL